MPQGRGKLLLLWMLFVLLCGCHLGGFLLLGNRLRKMGDFGFYGYWASWDLHNVFQRTDRLGTMWTQQEHKGTQKRVGGSSSIAALPQGQESAILPHSSETWHRGALRSKAGVCDQCPPWGTAHTWSSTNAQALLPPPLS